MTRFYRKKGGEAQLRPDGEIRRGQIVTTFGPGAMVDLKDHAILVTGLDFWEYSKFAPRPAIDEPRLRDHIIERYRLDLSPEEPFRGPPVGKKDEATQWSGIPALEFPAWFVCQGCSALLRASDGLEMRKGHRTHDCPGRRKPARCVPVRFVGACRRGHLQDYPWHYFAHLGGKCTGGTLSLREGRAGDFSEIRVACSCGQSQKLSAAMNADLRPRCEGHRPWLGRDHEECDENLHLLVRTASNGYFPQVLSALSIPDPDMELRDAVQAVWPSIENVSSAAELAMLRKLAPRTVVSLASYAEADVIATIESVRSGERAKRGPLRVAEFRRFVDAPEDLPPERIEDLSFVAQRIPTPKALSPRIERVVLARRLREVRAIIGFTRLEPPNVDVQGELDLEVELSKLTLQRTWLPATEVWGEGIFIQLSEDAVREWEQRPAVIARNDELFAGHSTWLDQAKKRSASKQQKEDPPFLGVRFYLLHSLSHMLMSAISMECGYAASAMRERIYCGPSKDDPTPMAAILIDTGSSGSEGTLGGLVDQGHRLEHHLARAIDDATLCSNDPVCARHTPAADRSERYLEGAACHGCLFVAECSCERFNRYLDRALVVPAMGHDPDLAFFGSGT